MAIRETRSKKITILMSTYFYQRWALFISKRIANTSSMSEIRRPSKITEHPCNEIKVHLHKFMHALIINIGHYSESITFNIKYCHSLKC